MTAPLHRTYHGIRTGHSCFVWCDDGYGALFELPARHDVRNHSPDGYEWGYGGSGPAQLALALTLDVLGGDVDHARRIYQDVKWRVVTRLRRDSWTLSAADLLAVVNAIDAEQGAIVDRVLARNYTVCGDCNSKYDANTFTSCPQCNGPDGETIHDKLPPPFSGLWARPARGAE